MAELKTQKNDASVDGFLSGVENDIRREDSLAVLQMMKEVTGEEPKMWGDSIVGFGDYHYFYASGREGDWFLTGLSPRKQNLTIYLTPGFDTADPNLARLGKHKLGKGCLYINKLSDVDETVLREIVVQSYNQSKSTGP